MKKYRDHYFKRAKQDKYPARSVYKLKEIDKRFHILANGQSILDLGAAPGSWTMFAAEKVGPQGSVLAVDLQETDQKFAENVTFLQGDVFEPPPEVAGQMAAKGPFNVVVSDMAPKTTGHKSTDQARSMALAEEALALACEHLILGGNFVVKVFQGPDDQAYMKAMRKVFDKVKSFKPKSSRQESKEIFYVGLDFKGGDPWEDMAPPV
jgi:23S rRNA (uridine2552-2'-O)-methyltransferase